MMLPKSIKEPNCKPTIGNNIALPFLNNFVHSSSRFPNKNPSKNGTIKEMTAVISIEPPKDVRNNVGIIGILYNAMKQNVV